MSWTGAFKTWLESPQLPRFAVRGVDPPFASAAWLQPSTYTKIDSHADMTGNPIIAAQGIRQTSPMRLDTGRWICSGGEWQVSLAVSPDDTASQWLANLRRGQIFQILAGPHTFTEAQLEPIAVGVLYGVRTSSDHKGMTLTIRSILSAMGSRITGQTNQIPLFYDIADPATRRQTTTAANYSPGDTTLQVVSTTGFEYDSAHAGVRLLIVDPGGTPGTISSSAFFLKASGTATGPIRFSGVGTVDLYGTTLGSAVSGSPVYSVPFSYGHPIDVAMRFVFGAGFGTGIDTMPAEWGLNFSQVIMDVSDAGLERLNATASGGGTYEVEVLATAQQENPLAWLQSWMAPHGIFWTLRHGQLTLRAPATPGRAVVRTGIVITDDDIVSFNVDAFDSAKIPVRLLEYEEASGAVLTSLPIATMETLPVNSTARISFPHVWTNAPNALRGVYARLRDYSQTLGEIFSLTCAGWRLAQLCPGDDVELTSSYFLARVVDGSTAVSSRPCLVLSVSVAWTTGAPAVSLVLMDLPDAPAPA